MPGKPLGHFINISLTPHYNPIIRAMFTAILVSLMWLDSFFFHLFIYFLLEFIMSTLPVEIAAAHWWKIHFPLCPLKPSELSAASFVVSLGFFCFCPFIPHSGTRLHAAVVPSLSSVTFNCRFLTAATKALLSPQISTLSSRPSSQSFSPSQSHCLAIHLFFEQANWFHKHEESAEGNRRKMTITGDSIGLKK